MKTNIIVKLQVEGLHVWWEAETKLPEVAYLSHLHRHIFYITCKQTVNHLNRDTEFIMLKHMITEYLTAKYHDDVYNCLNFNGMSCEMLAVELVDKFNLCYCSVFEDNENGAEIIV